MYVLRVVVSRAMAGLASEVLLLCWLPLVRAGNELALVRLVDKEDAAVWYDRPHVKEGNAEHGMRHIVYSTYSTCQQCLSRHSTTTARTEQASKHSTA